MLSSLLCDMSFLHLYCRWRSRYFFAPVNDLFSSGLMLIVIGVVSKGTPMLLALILHWSAYFSRNGDETSWMTRSNHRTKCGCSSDCIRQSFFLCPAFFLKYHTDVVLMLFMTGDVRAEPYSSLRAFTHSSQRVNIYTKMLVISQMLLWCLLFL